MTPGEDDHGEQDHGVRDDLGHRACPSSPPPRPARRAARCPAPVVRDLRERAGPQPARPALRTRRPGRGHRPARQRQVDADAAGGARHPASTPRTPATAGTPASPASCRTPSTGPSSASPTTPGCAAPCARARASSCTTAGRRPGCAAGSPARPDAGAAPCICCCSTSTPDEALEGQRERGRGVSRYAFPRHRGAATRLLRAVEKGRPARGLRVGGADRPGRGGRPAQRIDFGGVRPTDSARGRQAVPGPEAY